MSPPLDAVAPVSQWTQENAWAVTAGSPLPPASERAALLERAARRQAAWREEAAAPQPPPLATTGRGLTSSPQNPARRRPPSASRTPEQEDDLAHALSEMDRRVASRRAAERAAVRNAEERHQEQMRIYEARREARLHEQRQRVRLRREHTESSTRERLLSHMCARIAAGVTGGLYPHADPLVAEAYQRVAAARALRRSKPNGSLRRAGGEHRSGSGGCADGDVGRGGDRERGDGSAGGGHRAALATAESREAERQIRRRGLRVASAEYAAQLEVAAMVAIRQTPPEEPAAEQADGRRSAPSSPRVPQPPLPPPQTPPRSPRTPQAERSSRGARGASASSAARTTAAAQHGAELDARLCASPLLTPLKSRFSTPTASASPRRHVRVDDSPRGSTAPPARYATPPGMGDSSEGAVGATPPRVQLASVCAFEHTDGETYVWPVSGI